MRAVAAKEWLELCRDSRLVWLCAFVVALMLAALAFGYVEKRPYSARARGGGAGPIASSGSDRAPRIRTPPRISANTPSSR